MIAPVPDAWVVAGFVFHLAGAIAAALAFGWMAGRGDRNRPERAAALGALATTAAWCVIAASFGPASPIASLAESARNLAWLMVLYRLFAGDGRLRSMGPIRPVLLALALVECLQPALFVVGHRFAVTSALQELTFNLIVMFRMLVAVGALMMVHNLYAGASGSVRQLLRWSASALAGMWVYDLNLYTIAYLADAIPVEIAAMRGLVTAVVVILVALGAQASAGAMHLKPSRAVAFQTLSLFVIGVYLLVMIGLAYSLDFLGGDLGRVAQVGLLFAAFTVALLWLPSMRLRSWLRVTALKHLFQHRYDYREEWLRFNRTIGLAGEDTASLSQRIVKAVADITESSSGLLFTPGEEAELELAASWQWRGETPAGLPAQLARILQEKKFILDLDEARAGRDSHGEMHLVPDWLLASPDAWALVPLVHFGRMMGIVLVSRPPLRRALDWEDFDLLKLVGDQAASYLAEQTGQQALMEASRFDEFNRRIAFVMHDIKNLASQLSLLARNAERHADNPDFRADMLVTLRNSADKLNVLLDRLGRYGANQGGKLETIALHSMAERVARQYKANGCVTAICPEPIEATGHPQALEQALVHLVQNALDAGEPDSPVMVEISADTLHARMDVVDSGCGMTPEFVRNNLFKPFVSSKNGGFGIGAFEARELVRAMGGRLDVDSRPGLGSRFTIRLPLALTEQNSTHNPDMEAA